MGTIVSDSLAPRRFAMRVLGFFAATATLIAAIGIFGVMMYSVRQRSREIGIRLALTLAGIVLGLMGTTALTHSLNTFVFGVKALDPLTLVTGCALLIVITLVACFLPAWRAKHIDPVELFRSE